MTRSVVDWVFEVWVVLVLAWILWAGWIVLSPKRGETNTLPPARGSIRPICGTWEELQGC